MQNYEQLYKEALQRAKKELATCYSKDMPAYKQVLRIFPELKESEDEKSKKWILEYLHDGLRKSDEQFEDQFKCAIAWLEKQGEQKPDNKVEPKFKVGDWIVNNEDGSVGQILKVNYLPDTDNYSYEHTNGYFFWHFEKDYHLWTIEDAKDGDVLFSLDSNTPFIFKERKQCEQATAYCGVNKYGQFFVWHDNYCIITLDNYIPATREQRDLLFSKMREAGYEWNPDKKELKTIEQKSTEEHKGNNGGISPNFEWSEEDEKIKTTTILFLEYFNDRGDEDAVVCIDWLKSLRPNHWKPTKEQMRAPTIISHECNNIDIAHPLLELINDLKKL